MLTAPVALATERRVFAPIRHHSPACAFMVRAAIRQTRPDMVLIEAPADLETFVPLLCDPGTVPPVALVAVASPARGGATEAEDGPDAGRRPADITYIPFARHSPELVAIREARAIGARVRFIDLPCAERRAGSAGAGPPVAEQAFGAADFIQALTRELALRDGDEVWDHLFETRLGQDDWRGFFADTYAYCAALRATTATEILAGDDTLAREAAMRWHLREAGEARVVVVAGGFHVPALLDHTAPVVRPATTTLAGHLVRYSEDQLDSRSGYGAGLRFTRWYDRLWDLAEMAQGAPDWGRAALEAGLGFAAASAAGGRRVGVPQTVELVSLATGLARLKGREAVLARDLIDAARVALVKSETGITDPHSETMVAWLTGHRLGEVPAAAGQPPLIADARARARHARIDLGESLPRPRSLDIRRNRAHRETSRFLYQMSLLETGFARLREGPDFISGHRKGLLHEDWLIAWTPLVETRLITLAGQGVTIPQAAGRQLEAQCRRLAADGQGNDLPALTRLVLLGLRAGLARHLGRLVDALGYAIAVSADLGGLAGLIDRLSGAALPDDPLYDPRAPDLVGVCVLAFDQAIALVADLATAPDDALPGRIDDLRTLDAMLRGPFGARFDHRRFLGALDDLLASRACLPRLAGAVTALMVRAGHRPSAALATLLRGTLTGVGIAPPERAQALEGMIATAPMLLWLDREILTAANAALADLDETTFLSTLPSLRRGFTRLAPHETDRLAEALGEILSVSAGQLTSGTVPDAALLARAAAADRALDERLAADGLAHWGDA